MFIIPKAGTLNSELKCKPITFVFSFIASANNRVTLKNDHLLNPHDWASGYRAKRITEQLKSQVKKSNYFLKKTFLFICFQISDL